MVIPSDGQWGSRLGNGTWTGTIGMVLENKADIAIGKIGINEDRASVLDYSYSYDMEALVFATPFPGLKSKTFSFLWPFAFDLWLSLWLMVPVLAIAYRNLLSRRYNYVVLVQNIIGSFLHQESFLTTRKNKDKALLAGWWLGATFLSSSYMAILLTFLTISVKEAVFKDLEELATAVTSGHFRCFTFEGDTHVEIFRKSPSPKVKEMGEMIVRNRWHVKTSNVQVRDVMGDGMTAVVTPSYFFLLHMPGEVYICWETISSLSRGVFFRKGSKGGELFDDAIHRLTAGGFYHKFLDDYMFRQHLRTVRRVSGEEPVSVLTIVDLKGVFFLLALGLSVSLLVLLVEISMRKKRCRKKDERLFLEEFPPARIWPLTGNKLPTKNSLYL